MRLGVNSAAGDTIDITLRVAAPQLEFGSFATSFIPTSGSAVTRAADVFTIPTGTWYNQAVGAAVGVQSYTSSSGTEFPKIWRFDDGTSNNRWDAYYVQISNQIGVEGYTAGVNQGTTLFAGLTSATTKIAACNSLNNMRAVKDGVLGTPDTTWSPPTVTQYNASSVGPSSKTLHSFKYYPIGISDTQLQLLTQ